MARARGITFLGASFLQAIEAFSRSTGKIKVGRQLPKEYKPMALKLPPTPEVRFRGDNQTKILNFFLTILIPTIFVGIKIKIGGRSPRRVALRIPSAGGSKPIRRYL
ncbi:MAG: hypothetical protein CMF59_03205 [Leptospiraceae bacterium]|nr:hypothetical protein [Leptospiraceae bacterium]